MGLFLEFLGLAEVFFTCYHKISKIISQLISRFEPEVEVNIFFVKDLWLVFTIKFEWRIPNTDIFPIIVSKFDYEYESYQVILFVDDKDHKVGFHYAILFFGLAIGVKIKDRIESLLDI